ncbi:ORF53 [Bovine gammaherpesvirus 6]|uniref:ORF53 n=1 Tax=Bovine gammaherpesvirus 6 TaxID=1504288 RepID=A0A060CXN2_9GAMA|nr:ORF53 [Bovine gammaherpesvirus 6]AIB03208.1 ORF53 [Bovine gammaherpesvirus 6]
MSASLKLCLYLALACAFYSETATLPHTFELATPPSPSTAANATVAHKNDQEGANFYKYSCNADTYPLKLTSFSSIWALVNVLVVVISTVIYMMYHCFNKFVNTLIYP